MLADADADDPGITLAQFLDEQRALELEAAEALPYRFDQCTWDRGPIRQNLFLCPGCPAEPDHGAPRAYCYACAVTCHGHPETETETEGIWSRRDFLCDCPATGHCHFIPKLRRLHELPGPHRNSYHQPHNFAGCFCYCRARGWTGTQSMYQCEVCEDWFHDACVAQASCPPAPIPAEDAFDDFICAQCVSQHTPALFAHLPVPPAPGAPLFLGAGWRAQMAAAFAAEPFQAILRARNLLHLVRDPEPVFSPEEDADAKCSLYERTIHMPKASLILILVVVGLKALHRHAPPEKVARGIRAFDAITAQLKAHCEEIAATQHRAITAHDIHDFFAGMPRK